MNSATLDTLRSQIENILKTLETVIAEASTIEFQMKQVNRDREILSQKEDAMNQEKAKVRTEHDDIASQVRYIAAAKIEMDKQKTVLEETEKRVALLRDEQAKREKTLDDKLHTVHTLTQKEKDLAERESDLLKEKETVRILQSQLEREKIADRERKQILEEKEKKIKEQQERISKFISLTE